MIEIIIFAIIAFFVIKKLNSILGEENDESFFGNIDNYGTSKQNKMKDAEKIEDLTKENSIAVNDLSQKSKDCLREIEDIFVGFSLANFQEITSKVLESIIKANNDRNTEIIKTLMSKQLAEIVCNSFNEENKNNIILVELKESKILELNKNGNVFEIKVLFKMKQINYTTDKDDNIIDGNRSEIIDVNEQWTFTHNVSSKGKIWFVNKIEEC